MFIFLSSSSHERIFSYYFRHGVWGSGSKSGPGSEISQTQQIIEELPLILNDFSIQSIIDVPCGDFNWFSKIDLKQVKYLGIDIVKEVVNSNQRVHGSKYVSFQQGNIINTEIDACDLIICRDLFIHFSNDDIFLSLFNLVNSKAKYLLTTSFVDRSINSDILTGQFRPLNLSKSPFNLPQPLRILNENCTESSGSFSDKSLCLWSLNDIRKVLRVNGI
jgi:SAM-dependent methyltransferase